MLFFFFPMAGYLLPASLTLLLSGCKASKTIFGKWNPWDREVYLVDEFYKTKGTFYVYVHDSQKTCWVDFYGETIDSYPSFDRSIQRTMEWLLERNCPEEYDWQIAK